VRGTSRALLDNIVNPNRKLLALTLVASTQAFGFSALLRSDTSKLEIEIADLPGSRDRFVVAWKNLPGPTPSGAMIYRKDEGQSESHYFAVGGGGLFAIVDHGARRRHGFAVVADDPAHPEAMFVDSREVDVPALMAKYAAFENIAGAAETQPVIEATLTARAAQLDKTCRGHLAPQVRWADFTKPGKLAFAKQAISILDAIEAACTDKDYRAAVARVTALSVGFQADGGALQLSHSGTTLAVVLSDTSFNPRESAALWLKDKL
jgi:hypothetical protein